MRIFAIHDAAGSISEVIACPDDAPPPVLMTQPGLSLTEIEPPAGLDTAESQTSEGLKELAENYRVEVAPHKATLVAGAPAGSHHPGT